MKIIKIILFALFFTSFSLFSQQKYGGTKVTVSGKVIEKATNQPLEYTAVSLVNTTTNKITSGGMTDTNGNFSFDASPGTYNVKVEFISFKPLEIKGKTINSDTNLGTIALQSDAAQLKEVVVKGQTQSVEIKLDKKVYNVGQDATAKGGTASDVLDNVPSVTVDGDGNVSLRGNDNVKILIDGKPSNAVNIADALKNISADALDKVEVITNPSSRYDAEGSAGIINIILKKGNRKGINGTIAGVAGTPRNYGVNGTLNYQSHEFNLFSGFGYNDSSAPGRSLTDSNYLNADGSTANTINERIKRISGRKGFNYNFGLDWYLDKTLTWTNAFTYRKYDGSSPITDDLYHYENNNNFIENRYNDQFTKTNDIQYTTDFTKKFKKEGHKLSVDFTYDINVDNDYATIYDSYSGAVATPTQETTTNLQTQTRNLLQSDYVLPIGKNGQFEAGYKGNFNELAVNYSVGSISNTGIYTPNNLYSNIFDYKEKINALYSQFGSKYNKFSYLFGLRYENSNIDINLVSSSVLLNKKYGNFFPSAFLTYQLNDESSLSLNYSRRVERPRSRFIIPFSNYTSNVNVFMGNPDINPSYTDAVELGYMNKWKKFTLTSSVYYNQSKNPFQFIRRPNGNVASSTVIVNGVSTLVATPVYLFTPINLDSESRYGLEFNMNYIPYKWWRLNGNFNFFESNMIGNYSYSLIGSTNLITANANKTSSSWFAKISSKITLPYKIDWQTNATYNAPQATSQGKTLGVFAMNLAFSKDVLKDKATISLNVNDLLNSRKRIMQTNLPTLNSYSEMQFKERQINISFVYRFNKVKTEREKQPKNNDENGGGGEM